MNVGTKTIQNAARRVRRGMLAAGIAVAGIGSCTGYATTSYDCYYYYGYSYPYCSYAYMDPWLASGGYYPVYYSTLDPSLTPHPDPMLAAKESKPTVTLTSYTYIQNLGDEADGDKPPSPSSLNDSHPCGSESDSRLVLCADGEAEARDEDYIVVGATAEQEIEADHQDDFLVISFSFLRDEDASNDYVPASELANDYVGGTDKFFVASRTPDNGWSMEAFESDGASISTVDSDARIVLEVDTAVLMVPAAEFDVDTPASRISFFRHGGDEGTGADANWDGFVYPPLGEDLIRP